MITLIILFLILRAMFRPCWYGLFGRPWGLFGGYGWRRPFMGGSFMGGRGGMGRHGRW